MLRRWKSRSTTQLRGYQPSGVSFLIFSLYLLIIATTIEHRQLFLADPVKLPVLNIDLPLWGFYFLAPILFVIFHAYVLLQVLLLGRTAAAYNEAVEKVVERGNLAPEEEASLRQRLANTLFAQIFAGSPREREGWLGLFLKIMAWITLAIAPILILVVFQFSFLPYHSHLATWTHRVLILIELAAVFLIWPLVLDARRDFKSPNVWVRIKRAGALPRRLFGPKHGRRDEWLWLRQQATPVAAFLLYVIVALSLATFPGEPHVNLFTGHSPWSVQCERWIHQRFTGMDLRFDRLGLPRVDVVDKEKLKKIEEATKAAGERPDQGERMRILRERDLNCGDFSDYADLRRVDLTGAHLANANLESAKLHGASLSRARLQGASLYNAHLHGASLDYAQLQAASFDYAQLQGASLQNAGLHGASLYKARLHGASLASARLHGASLFEAQLQGAYLDYAELQGASLVEAQLQGASFIHVQLQGANLNKSSMTYSHVIGSFVWRAKNAPCGEARVRDHQPKAIVDITPEIGPDPNPVRSTSNEIADFIESSVSEIPDGDKKETARLQMRFGLVIDPAKDDTAAIAEVWSECEAASAKPSREEFDRKFNDGHAEFLRKLVCENAEYGKAVAEGIITTWHSVEAHGGDLAMRLARGLLGIDGKACPGANDVDERFKQRLRRVVAVSSPVQVPAPNR